MRHHPTETSQMVSCVQAHLGQPLCEATEEPKEDLAASSSLPSGPEPDDHQAEEARPLLSMLLPSNATHKRFAFIFEDNVKVRETQGSDRANAPKMSFFAFKAQPFTTINCDRFNFKV